MPTIEAKSVVGDAVVGEAYHGEVVSSARTCNDDLGVRLDCDRICLIPSGNTNIGIEEAVDAEGGIEVTQDCSRDSTGQNYCQ